MPEAQKLRSAATAVSTRGYRAPLHAAAAGGSVPGHGVAGSRRLGTVDGEAA